MLKFLTIAVLGVFTAGLTAWETRAATILAAGDVAGCASDHTKDMATGNLVKGLEGTVLALGDLAYKNGTMTEFTNCYSPVWGSFKSRTWPIPGNHEYNTSGASGYFSYFGSAAKPSGNSYYRKTVGKWSVYALNHYIASGSTSAQAVWLENQLKADPNRCQIAYWHEPYISSGIEHGNSDRAKTLFALAYKYRIEIVLAGHDHNYERFAEMRPDRQPANLAAGERGVRLFTVGTGGVPQRGKGSTKAGSQKFANGYGVLQLTLGDAGTYAWSFQNAAGSTINDSGSGTCLPAATNSTPVYLGCYLDKGTVGTLAGRDLDGYLLSDTAGMTNEKCAATCGGRNFAFAGTESGKQCFCGNDYGSFGSSKASCTAACSGNKAQICGGSWALSIYRLP